MTSQIDHIDKAAKAFSAQAEYFDKLYSANEIIRYKRERVRNHLIRLLKPKSNILELNAGTGEDAFFLAGLGYRVHATDIADGMINSIVKKIEVRNLNQLVTVEACSFTTLNKLEQKGPFDCVFSNFAGLNCSGNLRQVLADLGPLVKPGGNLVLVVLPKFCLWEFLLFFKGEFKTSLRRFFSSKGRKAKIDQQVFRCWYYNPGYIKKYLKDEFSFLELEGLCTLVPPSYIEFFAEKHNNAYKRLCKIEERVKNKWPWRSIGDYYIISFRKK